MAAALKTSVLLLLVGLTAHADNDSKPLDESKSPDHEWWKSRQSYSNAISMSMNAP